MVLAVDAMRMRREGGVELIIVDDLLVLPPGFVVHEWAPGLSIKVVRSGGGGQLNSIMQALPIASGEAILSIDPDMSGNLDDFDQFIELHESGCRLVYAVRVSRSDVSMLRVFISKIYNRLARAIFLLPAKDINTPMLLISADIVPFILSYDGRHGHAKIFFPYVLGAQFSEVEISVVSEPKKSSYSYVSLFFLMISHCIDFSRFLFFRLSGGRYNIPS